MSFYFLMEGRVCVPSTEWDCGLGCEDSRPSDRRMETPFSVMQILFIPLNGQQKMDYIGGNRMGQLYTVGSVCVCIDQWVLDIRVQNLDQSNIHYSMNRAKSALPRTRPIEVEILDQQLHHQIKKANLLDADRTDFWRHAEDIKEKNRQEIERLRTENIKLKHLRDELSGIKKQRRNSAYPIETTDENYWRRQFDKEKHSTTSKKNMLLNLQGILEELEDNKTGMTEESPLVKNIRVLENRLDKVMIKYNEAQSIRKTYEQIAKRLKEQRIKYDNELATIEKTLKGKSHDYEQLLLLAHDATHAKEIAQTQLKKFEVKKQSVDELRGKYLKQKRGQLELKRFVPRIQTAKQKQVEHKPNTTQTFNFKQESNFQKQQLIDYEDAYRKLKEVTGVLDANQIIQKFKTQGLTTQEFERQKKEYQAKIQKLRVEYDTLRDNLDKLKFKEEKGENHSTESYLTELERLEHSTNEVRNVREKMRVKEERLQKILINIKAGTKHISSNLDFYKIQHFAQAETPEESMLQVISKKIMSIYKVVMNDPDYDSKDFKQTPSRLQQYFQSHNHLNDVMKNVRLQQQLQESLSEDDFEESFRLQEKMKKMDMNKRK